LKTWRILNEDISIAILGVNNFPLLRNFATLAQVPFRSYVGKIVITPTCFCAFRHYLATSMLAYSYFRRRDFSSSLSWKLSLKLVTSETETKHRGFKSIFSAQIAVRELLHIVNSRRKCKNTFGKCSRVSSAARSKQLKLSA